jgi:hypothetical protein
MTTTLVDEKQKYYYRGNCISQYNRNLFFLLLNKQNGFQPFGEKP